MACVAVAACSPSPLFFRSRSFFFLPGPPRHRRRRDDVPLVPQPSVRGHDLYGDAYDSGLQLRGREPLRHEVELRLAAELDVPVLELLRPVPLARELPRDDDLAAPRAGLHDPAHG